jgi:hypothetical protein
MISISKKIVSFAASIAVLFPINANCGHEQVGWHRRNTKTPCHRGVFHFSNAENAKALDAVVLGAQCDQLIMHWRGALIELPWLPIFPA